MTSPAVSRFHQNAPVAEADAHPWDSGWNHYQGRTAHHVFGETGVLWPDRRVTIIVLSDSFRNHYGSQ
jgi:hypothetical protein